MLYFLVCEMDIHRFLCNFFKEDSHQKTLTRSILTCSYGAYETVIYKKTKSPQLHTPHFLLPLSKTVSEFQSYVCLIF